MTRSRIVRSICRFGLSIALCQAVTLAQTSMTPQTAPAPTIVPAWPDGPGFEITGLPDSEIFVILGAGGEEEITRAGGNGLPSQGRYISTGTVEGYVETDSLDVSDVNFTGSGGTLTVNGTNAGIAPTVTNATSSVTAFSASPTNNATYQLTGETQTCYLVPISGGNAPPPEPPPCGDDCGDPGDPDPGPEAVSGSQITLTPIAQFAEGSGYPTSYGGCYAFQLPPVSVTFTGVPHITSISQQSANVNSSGTFTVTGTNLEDSEGISTPNFNTTITSSLSGSPGQTNENVSFSVPSTQTPGSYQFTISNMWGTSNPVSFTVLPTMAPPNPIPDPCAVTSNPQVGYSSFGYSSNSPTGTNGSSGSIVVSFSGTAFAATSQSVKYGPYSTPSSIAANIAALITKNYFQYGLSAKSFGSNIVYSGNATLGAVSNMFTSNGAAPPSFTTTTSSTEATETENACDSAFPPGSVTSIYFIDPYLVQGYNPNSPSIDPLTVLSSLPSTTDCDVNGTSSCAAGLVRDGSSTAIIVIQEAQPDTVQLSINATGATLLQYDPGFLGKTPTTGQNTLAVTPISYNGSYYALALLLAPPDSSSIPYNGNGSGDIPANVNLRATVNSAPMYGSLPLIYPIAVLVHGIWGSETSLNDGTVTSVGPNLRANGYPLDWVQPLCYSSYVTWYATTDTVPNGNVCEQTSATAIANTLKAVYPIYDGHHFVGGRVDMIAHSMGGLAARNYAGLPNYQIDPRSRNLGAIHNLITIDTPIQGSGLASYMLQLATAYPLQSSYGGLISAALLKVKCNYDQTGQDCFNSMGLPLAAPDVDPSTGQPFFYTTGAVFSLQPYVINQQASPIKPVNSTWTAISASFSDSALEASTLRFILQNLTYNFYNPDQTAPTLTAEINDPSVTNDVIVGTTSQTVGYGGVSPDFGSPIGGNLEHTMTPGVSGFQTFFLSFVSPSLILSDADVLHSDDVNTAILKALKQ